MGETVGNCANVAEAFARQLEVAAKKEPERKRRQEILSQMFAGDTVLLEEGYSFDDMFHAFDEHIADCEIRGMVRLLSDNIKSVRGRKRRLL